MKTNNLPSLLIVDDEPMLARAMRRMLSDRFVVVTLSSVEEALRMIANGAWFDVIISDLFADTGGPTGRDLYECLLSDNREQALRVVILTGHEPERTAERSFAKQLGDRFLTKPISATHLRQIASEVAATPLAPTG